MILLAHFLKVCVRVCVCSSRVFSEVGPSVLQGFALFSPHYKRWNKAAHEQSVSQAGVRKGDVLTVLPLVEICYCECVFFYIK